MANSAPTDPSVPSNDPQPAPDAAATVVLTPTFEERLHFFWKNNAKTVYVVCLVVLLAIVGRGAYEWNQRRVEQGIQAEYAKATTPEKLKSFVAQNGSHVLAGVAALRLADEAYSASNYSEAQSNYQRASESIKTGPLSGRARLGSAVSKIHLNQAAAGEEELKAIANDVALSKTIRGEAAFHVGSLASDAGRIEDAAKYYELCATVDGGSIWGQRAMMSRATLPTPSSTPAAADVSVQLPAKP